MLKIALYPALFLALTVCTPTSVETDAGATDAAAADAGPTGHQSCTATTPVCTTPNTLPCEDQLYQNMSYNNKTSTGAVATTDNGSFYTTTIDASAGGMNNAANNPYVYVKFNATSLDKVSITDDAAMASMDWDIALKRFTVVVNSGDVGPSCVGVLKVNQDFDAVTAPATSASYTVEHLFDASCVFQKDNRFSSMGFDSPDAALKFWWDYQSCVETTGKVHVLRLANGCLVKFVVDAYYQTGQEDCNSTGSPGTGSGKFTVRWEYL